MVLEWWSDGGLSCCRPYIPPSLPRPPPSFPVPVECLQLRHQRQEREQHGDVGGDSGGEPEAAALVEPGTDASRTPRRPGPSLRFLRPRLEVALALQRAGAADEQALVAGGEVALV